MSTVPPMGAESPIEVTFPDGSTATFDQLRDMLDEFHDGELDPATQEKVKYALEHCPRLAQESSVIIGISRLLKNYEGPHRFDPAGPSPDEILSSKILGRVKGEPPPATHRAFPWGAVVVGFVTLAIAAGIGLYIYSLNAAPPADVDLTPRPVPTPPPDRVLALQELRLDAVITASQPSVNVLKGKVLLFSPGEMSRELKSGEEIHLTDGQRVELEPDSLVMLAGAGKGALKIEHVKNSAPGQNTAKPKIEYQTGRLPVVSSVLQPAFWGTQQAPFAYTWHSVLANTDQHFFFLPGLKENNYPSRAFEYTGPIYQDGATGDKKPHFEAAKVHWLAP